MDRLCLILLRVCNARGPHQVRVDGVEVEPCPCYYKQMPDGVGKGDDAVALEENDAQDIHQSAECQLINAIFGTLLYRKKRI